LTPSADILNVYHFSVVQEGGVHTVIKNIIHHAKSKHIEYHILYLNNTAVTESVIPPEKINHSFIRFSKHNNLYTTLTKINSYITKKNAVLACHDWTELAMVAHLGLSYPVVFFMHGDYDYYYDTAVKNNCIISVFVAPTASIYNRLLTLLPNRKSDIIQAFYPVPTHQTVLSEHKKLTCAYYVSNLSDENKNFKAIPIIDKILVEQGVYVNWNIAGGGIKLSEFIESWESYDPSRIHFSGYLQQEELAQFIQSSSIFVLPSKVEGIPIALVESMKSGLIPIVNEWNDSVLEYITSGENGFLIKGNNLNEFAEKIILLNNDRNLIKSMSEKVKASSKEQNAIDLSISKIENIFFSLSNLSLKRKKQKLYGSRLDHPLIPNVFTKIVRRYLSIATW